MIIELPPNLPVGVRFHPTDQELITRYLRPKILGHHFDDAIAEINLCDWEPWELPHKSKIKSKDSMWWFMCRLESKHPNSRRSNRKTKTGTWKSTGQERTIKDQDNKACIGKKRTLVFHSGPTPGKRTNWVMHEYYLDPEIMLPQQTAPYVICRLKKKTNDKVDTPDGDRGEPIGETIFDLEILGPSAAIQQLNDQTEANHKSDLPYGGLHLTDDDINFILSDDYAERNELQVVNSESEECSDEFVNGLIADPDEIYCNETTSNLFNDSSLPASQKRSYFMDAPYGSDTDAEGVSAWYVQTLESASPFDLPTSSKRVRHMRVFTLPSQLLRTSATSEHCGQENVVSVPNPLYKEGASSSNTSRPAEMLSTISIKQPAEPPKHVNVRGGVRQKRIQIQKNSPSTATSSNKRKEASNHAVTTADLPRKDKLIGETRDGGKEVDRSNVEKHFESAGCESSASKWKTVFTCAETSSVSGCDSRPRWVYWLNAITGAALFGIFVRELFVFGSW